MAAHPHRLWRFPGGLRLPHHTQAATAAPLSALPAPPRVYLPLDHNGLPLQPQVKAGQKVRRGQCVAAGESPLSVPIHASISGMVRGVVDRPLPHPSGHSGPCIEIESDGDEPSPEPALEPLEDYRSIAPQQLRERLHAAGIAGLGGAAFSTDVKLASGIALHTLIINGAECEPYISCDDMLLRSSPGEVLEGARVLKHLVHAQTCLIAVEDHMTEALAALTAALGAADDLCIVPVPSIYPAGGERQLVYTLTGVETPSGGFPTDLGVLCQNAGTAQAVFRAVLRGEPLISRIVTVAGEGVAHSCNLEVRLGTRLRDVIEACGGYRVDRGRLIMGGPMMGFELPSDEASAIKSTNCLLAPGAHEFKPPPPALPCIRCGDCVSVCPARLLPQQLHFDILGRDFEQAGQHALFDCIECGCCAYVCPSHLPLVHSYRYAKDEIHRLDSERIRADESRVRFARHQQHATEVAQAPAPCEPAAKTAKDMRKAMVEAARARAAARRKTDEAQ